MTEITHVKEEWQFVISGFRQRPGQPTGSQDLWAHLHARYGGPRRVVTYLPWNTNWREIAEQVRMCSNGHVPHVKIAGYSWGGGWGAVQLAWQLRHRGYAVQRMVLCDAVYRHPLWCLSWLALCRRKRITVPDNVERVRWFYQIRQLS